jgi:hypothetical protein
VFANGDLVETPTTGTPSRSTARSGTAAGSETTSFLGTPRFSELVSIDGSFKPGRDLDGGDHLPRSAGGERLYLEEFSLGNAEDVTEILSTTYSYGTDAELDELVPQALADQLCDDDCIVTRNWSLLEPGIFERKYLAPGIGVFLEVEPDAAVVVQLTDCNFDVRCATLPAFAAPAGFGARLVARRRRLGQLAPRCVATGRPPRAARRLLPMRSRSSPPRQRGSSTTGS